MATGTEQWKPAYDVHVLVDGKQQQTTTSEFSEDVEEFDTTNDQSAGNYEYGAGVVTRSLRWTTPVDSLDVRIPALKDLLPCTWSDGISNFAGNVRVMKRGRKGGGKGGYMIDYEGKFTGVVTES